MEPMRIKSYIDGLFFGNYSDDYGYQVKQSVYAFGKMCIRDRP